MRVREIQLSLRPAGRAISFSDGHVPFQSVPELEEGSTVELKRDDILIRLHLVEVEDVDSFIGQVTDLDGCIGPVFDGVRIGSYLRFREEHVFICRK